VRSVEPDAGPGFSDPTLALEAAAAGLGVVVASEVAADDLLRRGALVAVSELALPQPGFHLFCDQRRIGATHVRAVHDWLIDTAAAFRPA
jgi:LysR family glycine cleavage system transcriptional activator